MAVNIPDSNCARDDHDGDEPPDSVKRDLQPFAQRHHPAGGKPLPAGLPENQADQAGAEEQAGEHARHEQRGD